MHFDRAAAHVLLYYKAGSGGDEIFEIVKIK